MFLKYENQEIVNADYIVYIEINKTQILFIFSNPIIRVNWRFNSEEKASKVFEEINLQLNSLNCGMFPNE